MSSGYYKKLDLTSPRHVDIFIPDGGSISSLLNSALLALRL